MRELRDMMPGFRPAAMAAAFFLVLGASIATPRSTQADDATDALTRMAVEQRALLEARKRFAATGAPAIETLGAYRAWLAARKSELDSAQRVFDTAFDAYSRALERQGRHSRQFKDAAERLNADRLTLGGARRAFDTARSDIVGHLRKEGVTEPAFVLPLLGLTGDEAKASSDDQLIDRLEGTTDEQAERRNGDNVEALGLEIAEHAARLADSRKAYMEALARQRQASGPGARPSSDGLAQGASGAGGPTRIDCGAKELASGRNLFGPLMTPVKPSTALPGAGTSVLESVLQARRNVALVEGRQDLLHPDPKQRPSREQLLRDRKYLADLPALLGQLARNEMKNIDSRTKASLERLLGEPIDEAMSDAELGRRLLALGNTAAMSAELERLSGPRLFALHVCVEATYGGDITSWRDPTSDEHWRFQKVRGVYGASVAFPLHAAPSSLRPERDLTPAIDLHRLAIRFAKRAFGTMEQLRGRNRKENSLQLQMTEIGERARFDFWLNAMNLTVALDGLQSRWMLLVAPWGKIDEWLALGELPERWYATLDKGDYSLEGRKAVKGSKDYDRSDRITLSESGLAQSERWLGKSFYPWAHVLAAEPEDLRAYREALRRYRSDIAGTLPPMSVEEGRAIAAINKLVAAVDRVFDDDCVEPLAAGRDDASQFCLYIAPAIFAEIAGRWKIRSTEGRDLAGSFGEKALASTFGAPAFELLAPPEDDRNPSAELAPKGVRAFLRLHRESAAKGRCATAYRNSLRLANQSFGTVARVPAGIRLTGEGGSGTMPAGRFTATIGPGEWPCYRQEFSISWRLGPVE
jgi:hypothetical protein